MPFRQTGNRTWLVLLSTLFQGASFAVLWMFLPLYVSEIATISEIALIMALPYIATVLTANLWGYVSDFIGRRKPLILLASLSYTIMFLLIVTFGDVYRVIATLAVTSIFSSSWLIAMQTFVTQTEFKGKAVGRYLSTYSMGWFIAGILGGYISDSISVRAALVTGAVFSALAMFIFLPVKEERLRGVTLSLGEYLRVFRNRNMVIVGAVAVLTILIRSSFFSFIPVYFVDIIGGSKFLFGLSMSAGTLAGAVISGLLGALSDRIGRKPLLVLGNAIGILYFPLFLLTVDPTLVAVLFAMPVYPFIMTSLTALASDYSPTRIRGRAMGFLNTCVQGGRAVGPLIGGALALTKELVAIQRILVFATIGSVFITFLSWRFVTEGLIRQPQQVR